VRNAVFAKRDYISAIYIHNMVKAQANLFAPTPPTQKKEKKGSSKSEDTYLKQ
jgi:hypothetical protein